MSDDSFKRMTDQSVEAKGFVLYANKEYLELKVDFLEGATQEGLYSLLSSKGINKGLDDERIAQLFEEFGNGEPVFKETIAKGKRCTKWARWPLRVYHRNGAQEC